MRVIRALIAAGVVLVLAAGGLLLALPGEKIARIAADQVAAQTGRDLQFDGEVGISWYPVLGVTTGPVRFGNAEWSQAGPMFRAESLKIGVDVMALIGGDIRITQIDTEAPVIVLERAADGRVNWTFTQAGAADGGGAAPSASEGSGRAFSLDQVSIRNAALRYVDHGDESIAFSDVDAELSWGGAGRAAELSLSVTPDRERVQITASLADPGALLAGGVSALEAEVRAAGNTARFAGRAGLAPEAEGRLTLDLPRPGAFMAALGQGAAGIPGPVSLDGQVSYTRDGRLSLREGKARLAGNAADVEADVTLGGKPDVTARIAAGQLDLSALTGAGASGSGDGAGADAEGWSTARIDASALGAFDGTITLSAAGIDLGGFTLGQSRATVTVDNARAVVTLDQVQGYQGTITGEVVANNRSGFSVGGKLRAAGIEMQDLLSDAAGLTRLSGQADGELSFLGVGGSVDAIMNALSGSGSLSIGRGRIAGIDLDKLLRGDPSGGTTVFDSLTGTMAIDKGVMRNDDLRMDLPNVLARGKGRVGLGARDIDYTLTPQLRNETETGLAVPVRIRGPWSDPRIWPDMEAVVDQNFAKERDAVKQKLEQEVKDRLGVETEEGQSVEDAIEKKLEKEIGDKLRNLLGGN
ncbi:AsmA family protein [Salinihabitans flavidus]|nr:AsmA family protein [Salinihabitans flavidus]